MLPSSRPTHVAFSSMSMMFDGAAEVVLDDALATYAFTAEPVHGLTASVMASPPPAGVLPVEPDVVSAPPVVPVVLPESVLSLPHADSRRGDGDTGEQQALRAG